jgi:CRAL/TRIO domain
LKAITSVTALNFTGTLQKLYLLNPSSSLNFLWGGIKSFLDPVVAQKIDFVKESRFKEELGKTILPDQLEVKYGGSLPNFTTFWPPRTQFKSDAADLKAIVSRKVIPFTIMDKNYDKILKIQKELGI